MGYMCILGQYYLFVRSNHALYKVSCKAIGCPASRNASMINLSITDIIMNENLPAPVSEMRSEDVERFCKNVVVDEAGVDGEE